MTTTKKLTKRDVFTVLLDDVRANPRDFWIGERIISADEVIDKLENELVQLNAKANGTKKPTAVQIQNEDLKQKLLEFFDAHPDERFTCSALQKSCPDCEGLSTPKISVLVNQLCASGLIVKDIEKRVSYFHAI